MTNLSLLNRIESTCLVPATGISKWTLLTPDEIRAQLAEKIAGVLIHRINFPKVKAGKVSRKASLEAKMRPLLSPNDCDDVRGIVAFVLTATGAIYRDRLTFGDWKECFRAVRGPDGLRIDRQSKNKSEIVSIDKMTPEALDVISAEKQLAGLQGARRSVLARRINHLRACISASFSADKGRNRKANRKKALKFLRFLSSQYTATGQGQSEIVESSGEGNHALHMAKLVFVRYVENGDSLLTVESLRDTPTLRAPRFLKSFADLPA